MPYFRISKILKCSYPLGEKIFEKIFLVSGDMSILKFQKKIQKKIVKKFFYLGGYEHFRISKILKCSYPPGEKIFAKNIFCLEGYEHFKILKFIKCSYPLWKNRKKTKTKNGVKKFFIRGDMSTLEIQKFYSAHIPRERKIFKHHFFSGGIRAL